MKCETYMYWDPEHQTEGEGLCRRHPPVMDIPWILASLSHAPTPDDAEDLIHNSDNAVWWSWPTTVDIAWCGEYKEIMRAKA